MIYYNLAVLANTFKPKYKTIYIQLKLLPEDEKITNKKRAFAYNFISINTVKRIQRIIKKFTPLMFVPWLFYIGGDQKIYNIHPQKKRLIKSAN